MDELVIRFGDDFWNKEPRFLAYNRIPLLANVVYDASYEDVDIKAQHSYPFHHPFRAGDVVFIKTDYLPWALLNIQKEVNIQPFVLVTGVSDRSPSEWECQFILKHPKILFWIGCNIPVSHPKIVKVLIGAGEPPSETGNLPLLKTLHAARIPWDAKEPDICIPYHSSTHYSRTLTPTLPRLPYEEYMREISKHKFVVVMRGNGIDTHRFSEVLLMGSVPIVEHSGLDDLYRQFPCIIVRSFDTIDTSTFVWDTVKYECFLDMFWIRPTFLPIPR
jgi:hypothetical protein